MQINSNKLLLIDKTSPLVRPPIYKIYMRMVFGSRMTLSSVMRNDSLYLTVYGLNAQPARPHANVCYIIVSLKHCALQK